MKKIESIQSAEHRKELTFTLSVILEDNDLTVATKIEALQNLVTIHDLQAIPGSKIYRYPKETLHYSLINFYTYPYPGTFATAREEFENEEWLPEFKDFVTQTVFRKLHIVNNKFSFKRVYEKGGKTAEGRVALNLFAEDVLWQSLLQGVQKDVIHKLLSFGKRIRCEYIRPYDLKIYTLPDGQYSGAPHGAVNIFAKFPDADPQSDAEFIEQVNVIDATVNEENIPFVFQKAALVISDPYLSNPIPILIEG